MAELGPASRPERYSRPVDAASFGIVEKPLSGWERLGNVSAVRKLALLVLLALIWEGSARWLNNPLLFPTFTATIEAFVEAMASGDGGTQALESKIHSMLFADAVEEGALPNG